MRCIDYMEDGSRPYSYFLTCTMQIEVLDLAWAFLDSRSNVVFCGRVKEEKRCFFVVLFLVSCWFKIPAVFYIKNFIIFLNVFATSNVNQF